MLSKEEFEVATHYQGENRDATSHHIHIICIGVSYQQACTYLTFPKRVCSSSVPEAIYSYRGWDNMDLAAWR